jgi:hypothetical protein
MRHQKEKTVITVETFRRTVVSLRRKAKIFWCEQCATETVMILPNEAAAFLQTNVREIFRLTERGEIHYLETDVGELLVCRNSLERKNNFRNLL